MTIEDEIGKLEKDRENKFIWEFTQHMTKKHGTFHMFGAETCEMIAEVMHFAEKKFKADRQRLEDRIKELENDESCKFVDKNLVQTERIVNKLDKQLAEANKKIERLKAERDIARKMKPNSLTAEDLDINEIVKASMEGAEEGAIIEAINQGQFRNKVEL